MITAILYTLVFVLAFPTLAEAECAWVLWSQVEVIERNGSSARPWQIDNVYSTATECEAFQVVEAARLARTAGPSMKVRVSADKKSRVDHIYTRKDGEPGVATNRLQCLPDSIDPRGPKEGTR